MPITNLGYQMICYHSISKLEREIIIMIPITEKEEKELDSGFLQTNRDNQTFNIHSNEIICYGEIDFHTSSDDYRVIENMKWLDHLYVKGLAVPSDYDYEEHVCYPPGRKLRYTETFNPAVVAQYIHARLNKPERVCIFKEKQYVRLIAAIYMRTR